MATVRSSCLTLSIEGGREAPFDNLVQRAGISIRVSGNNPKARSIDGGCPAAQPHMVSMSSATCFAS